MRATGISGRVTRLGIVRMRLAMTGTGMVMPVARKGFYPCFFKYFSGSLSNFSLSSFEQKW